MSDLRIIETCACGASINVVGSKYRRDGDPRNPRGAEEVVERWREDHKHVTAARAGWRENRQGETMSDHIDRVRERAEKEAERLWPTFPNGGAARITDPACWVKRKAYVRGQVALASRLTRESIAEIIYANTEQVDYCGYGLMVVNDPLKLADKILALVREDTDKVENVLDCKREEEIK